MDCLPHKYVMPITDGASIWLHVGCHCGKSTHVVELAVAWTPRPPEEIPCAHCGRLFPPKAATRLYCTAGCRREAKNAAKRAARVAHALEAV